MVGYVSVDQLVWLLVPVLAICALFAAALAFKIVYLPGGKPRRRGFEVKLNTGNAPVPEKKANDHG